MRRSKTGCLGAAVLWTVAAAGCAAHPERPTMQVQAKAAPVKAKASRPPAHLFDGCLVIRASAHGYEMHCGLMAVDAMTQPGDTPEHAVEGVVRAFEQGFPKGPKHTSPAPVTVGGRTYAGTRLTATVKMHGLTSTWVQRFVGTRDAAGVSVVLSCGAMLSDDMARCTHVLAWLVLHPTPPPVATPAAGASWPPKGRLVTPAGCRLNSSQHGIVSVTCPKVRLTLMLIRRAPIGLAAYGQTADQWMKKILEGAKRYGGTSTGTADLECKVGGKPGSCRRIEVREPHGTEIFLIGVGDLFDTTTLLVCHWPDASAPLPSPCARLVTLGPPISAPAATPPATGVQATP